MASRKIEDLDKRFQPLVKDLLDKANKLTSPWKTFITDGFRTFEEQAKLYAQGRTAPGKIVTNAPPGTSLHEKGLAVDIAFQKDGELSYADSLYDKVVPIADGIGLTWGGRWKFLDKPHFQKTTFDEEPVVSQPEMLVKEQVIIDAYFALTGSYPTDSEINWRLERKQNTVELITDICQGDSRFKKKWVDPYIEALKPPEVPPSAPQEPTPVFNHPLSILLNRLALLVEQKFG